MQISLSSIRRRIVSQLADLAQIERNAFRDTVQDGLVDIFGGFFLFLMGGRLHDGSVAIVFPFIFLGTFLVAALKRRYVYPRIGYVELAQRDSKQGWRWLLGFGLAVVAVFVAVLLLSGDIRDAALWYRWMPIPFGMVMLAGFIIAARKSRLIRFYLYAALAAAGGATFPFLPLTGKLEALSLYLVALGLPMLVCGVVVFALFLRRNPVQPVEAQDE
jgi:hypothetical protein